MVHAFKQNKADAKIAGQQKKTIFTLAGNCFLTAAGRTDPFLFSNRRKEKNVPPQTSPAGKNTQKEKNQPFSQTGKVMRKIHRQSGTSPVFLPEAA